MSYLRLIEKSYVCRDTVLAKHLMDDCQGSGACAIDIGRTDGVNPYPFAALPALTQDDLQRCVSPLTQPAQIALPLLKINLPLDHTG